MVTYQSPGVYVEEVDSGPKPIEGVGTAVAAFLGFSADGPLNAPTLVTNWSQFVQEFGEYSENCLLPHAVQGYFTNGGGSCYVVRIGDGNDAAAANGANGHSVEKPGAGNPVALTAGTPVQLGPFRVRALPAASGTDAGGSGKADPPVNLKVEVDHDGHTQDNSDGFRIKVVKDGKTVETHDVSAKRSAKNFAATKVAQASKLIELEATAPSGDLTRPAAQTVDLPAPKTHAVARAGDPSADSGAAVDVDSYVGSSAERTGFGGLEAVEDITIVAAPDLMGAFQRGLIDAEGVVAVQKSMIAHCELMGDRVAILDTPPGLKPQAVKEWRQNVAGHDSKYAALYYPYIKAFDPVAGHGFDMPPSGHIAGVWARSDAERGVHKAPANEVIRGAIDLEMQLTKGEQDMLNPLGVNCVRSFPGRGIRVWGARTLSSDPSWRYLNIRRLFNYLEESILLGTQWVVFEPNDEALWSRIRRTISAFLVNEWRAGALFGLTPDEAFYVKCDSETNPPESVDTGQVVCEVGVAPVKPAEFVVFRLSQTSAGASDVAE